MVKKMPAYAHSLSNLNFGISIAITPNTFQIPISEIKYWGYPKGLKPCTTPFTSRACAKPPEKIQKDNTAVIIQYQTNFCFSIFNNLKCMSFFYLELISVKLLCILFVRKCPHRERTDGIYLTGEGMWSRNRVWNLRLLKNSDLSSLTNNNY